MLHTSITAQQGYGEYRPTCHDCGGTAAGQGPFDNRPYCRLCERHIASTGSAAERMHFNREPLAHVVQYDERNRLARIQADCRRLIGRAA